MKNLTKAERKRFKRLAVKLHSGKNDDQTKNLTAAEYAELARLERKYKKS
jgi:hypothetical protein